MIQMLIAFVLVPVCPASIFEVILSYYQLPCYIRLFNPIISGF